MDVDTDTTTSARFSYSSMSSSPPPGDRQREHDSAGRRDLGGDRSDARQGGHVWPDGEAQQQLQQGWREQRDKRAKALVDGVMGTIESAARATGGAAGRAGVGRSGAGAVAKRYVFFRRGGGGWTQGWTQGLDAACGCYIRSD